MRLNWYTHPAIRRSIQAAALLLFCFLFFYVCWPYGGTDYAATMQGRRYLPPDLFLLLDPLLSLSTAIAARTWIWALAWAAAMIGLSLVIPRGFCSYLCPLGTTIDLFDWALGRRIHRVRLTPRKRGWWVHLKYYILAATLIASTLGILVSGFFAAIPVITRGLQFTLAPIQTATLKGPHLVPPMNAGQWFSILLFVLVLTLGLLRRRFWCSYVCPTGALFSLANAWRLTERKVSTMCTSCSRCIRVCPFDAIKPDFTTRTLDCTLCQTCGKVCPTHAISFETRWTPLEEKAEQPEVGLAAVPLSRRGLLAAAAGGATCALGFTRLAPATPPPPLVRPPGSVPEAEFLDLCIRCGECFKVCPNNVLQPAGFEHGLNALWTPKVVANWSGCEPSCNNCGQVCPTGAIRKLSMPEKRSTHIGLAIIDQSTCLPYVGNSSCRMCVDECSAAGYNAIEFRTIGVSLDEQGLPIENTGRLVPLVLAEACIGCGLCQTRCNLINVKKEKLLSRPAIVVQGRK